MRRRELANRTVCKLKQSLNASLSKFLRDGGRLISLSERQPQKALSSILFKTGESSMIVKDVHYANTSASIFSRVLGKRICLSAKQCENVRSSNSLRLASMVTFSNAPQYAKQEGAMSCTAAGIVISFSEVHPINAE